LHSNLTAMSCNACRMPPYAYTSTWYQSSSPRTPRRPLRHLKALVYQDVSVIKHKLCSNLPLIILCEAGLRPKTEVLKYGQRTMFINWLYTDLPKMVCLSIAGAHMPLSEASFTLFLMIWAHWIYGGCLQKNAVKTLFRANLDLRPDQLHCSLLLNILE